MADDPVERINYIELLQAIVQLKKGIWGNWRSPKLPNDALYNVSSEIRVCLGYLAKLDHTIVLPIIAKYWLRIEKSPDATTKFSKRRPVLQ